MKIHPPSTESKPEANLDLSGSSHYLFYMSLFLVLAFLFCVGSIIGWSIELIYRRFSPLKGVEKKWVNPGFLTGPYLPIYGISLIVLFLLSRINVSFIQNPTLQKIVLFALMALAITAFEYVAGLIFIKGMKIMLWDYRNQWGNIQGIICPLYTFFWWILSAVYYFLIHPHIESWLYWFTNHIAFSFVIGFFYGIFVVDLFSSFQVMAKIRAFAKENKIVFRIENYKIHLQQKREERKEKIRYLLTYKAEKNLAESLKEYLEKVRHTEK